MYWCVQVKYVVVVVVVVVVCVAVLETKGRYTCDGLMTTADRTVIVVYSRCVAETDSAVQWHEYCHQRLGIAIPDPFFQSRNSGLENFQSQDPGGIMGSRWYGIKNRYFGPILLNLRFFHNVTGLCI